MPKELPGDRMHCFHQNVMNRETKRGVLCSETLMCRIWVKLYFEDNKDHLLNRARTDLARREIHVESLKKCLNVVQKERRHKTGHFKTYTTNLSNLVENKLDCKKNCCGKRKLFEIRRCEVCTKWEEWRERKNSKLKNSRCKKIEGKPWD